MTDFLIATDYENSVAAIKSNDVIDAEDTIVILVSDTQARRNVQITDVAKVFVTAEAEDNPITNHWVDVLTEAKAQFNRKVEIRQVI